MGFKLVKLEKDKAETAERSAPAESSIEEPGQAVLDKAGTIDPITLAQAEEVAHCTRELLDAPGWCLWKCSTLGGEVIAVVQDELVEGIPEGYPVYTEEEFGELCQDDVTEATIRLLHEAKKLAGAKVTTEGVNKCDGDFPITNRRP